MNLNWGDAINAFQQGVVDGQENPCAILTAVQIHPYHHYATVWNYAVDPLILVWSKAAWDAFPPDLQNTIRLLRVAPGAFPVRGVLLAARNALARRRGGQPPPGPSNPSCPPALFRLPFPPQEFAANGGMV